MIRLALLVASFLATLAAAPGIASACCADIDRHEPVGWSADGGLLVRAFSSTDCVGTLALEIHSRGDVFADARFDLYGGGGRLAEGDIGRVLDDEALWEMRDELAEGEELFPVPRYLERRFGFPVQSFVSDDLHVVGRADPSDALDAGFWGSHVLVTVRVRGVDGFVEVARDVRVDRSYAADGMVYVHPAPDGRHAILRFSSDGPEFAGDDIRWIAIPEGVTRSGRVGADAGAYVIADRDNLAEPGVSEDGYHIGSLIFARDQLAAATDPSDIGDLRAMVWAQANRSLWADPANDVLRAALVEALEGTGATDVAAEVAEDLPDTPLPTLASIDPERAEGAAPPPVSTPSCLDDAGCPMPAEIVPGPISKPTPVASCNVSGGASSTLVVVLPLFVFLGGLGVSALRRRRRR